MGNTEHSGEKFLSNLYFEDSEGKITLRFLPSGRNYFLGLSDLDKIHQILERHKRENAYFQVAMCDGRGGKANITEIPALWVDVDFKDGFSPKEFEKLPGIPIKPSIVVDSGGGRHLYWLLNEQAEQSDISEVENILKRLAQAYHGDPAAAEAARILRLPGTLNYKYNPPKKVEILEFEPNRQYDLPEFDEYLPKLDKPQTRLGNAPGWEKPIIEQGVKEGERNQTMARLAGKYLRMKLSRGEILPILLDINSRFAPPLKIEEVERTLASIYETHTRNNPPDGQKEQNPLEEVYSGWAGEYSAAMSKITEPPRSFFYFAALTCLGAVLSGRITLATEIVPQPRLFTVLLGESGDTRKSTAIKMAINFFTKAMSDFSVCHGVGSAEGLCEQFQKHNRLLLVYDELRTFVNKAKIETSVLLQGVTSLFELNQYQSVTKKHSIDISNAHLSILGASTVETYSTMFNSQFLDIGFINRLLVITDQGRKAWSIPPKADPGEKDRLKRQLGELLKLVTEAAKGGTMEMSLTPEASLRWDQYYFGEMANDQTSKRLDTYGLRLMPLLAINDGKSKIDLDTVRKVVQILRYEYKTRRLVDPIDADSRIAEMEERFRRVLGDNGIGVSLRDLKRAVNYNRYGLFIFDAAKNNLLRSREMKFDPKTKKYHLLDA